jgi:NAD(P)H-dependent FMN reductase
MNPPIIKILAISGSLRANSSNNTIIKAVAGMAPAGVQFTIYTGLAQIPPFDDSQEASPAVADFRQQLQLADGIFICTPEYAFGVSGVLKNALDWTVSSGELVNKPLALVTAATGGEKAHAALLLTFTALSSSIPEGGELVISYVRSKLDANGNVSDAATAAKLQSVLEALVSHCRQRNEPAQH